MTQKDLDKRINFLQEKFEETYNKLEGEEGMEILMELHDLFENFKAMVTPENYNEAFKLFYEDTKKIEEKI